MKEFSLPLSSLLSVIVVYKFTQKSREEIAQMLGLSDLKQTRVYQEALEEGIEEGERRGKLKAISCHAFKLLVEADAGTRGGETPRGIDGSFLN